MVLRKAVALLRQGIANARGDEQEPSQADHAGTSLQHKIKSSIHRGMVCILGAYVRKDTCLPREISRVVLDRRVRGKLTEGSSNRPRPHGRSQQMA